MIRLIVRKKTGLSPVLLYRQIFNYEFDLAFFKPKKYQCHIRESHRNITEKKEK
jgi:hypothetical protein